VSSWLGGKMRSVRPGIDIGLWNSKLNDTSFHLEEYSRQGPISRWIFFDSLMGTSASWPSPVQELQPSHTCADVRVL
jgi:hypothetical protein